MRELSEIVIMNKLFRFSRRRKLLVSNWYLHFFVGSVSYYSVSIVSHLCSIALAVVCRPVRSGSRFI